MYISLQSVVEVEESAQSSNTSKMYKLYHLHLHTHTNTHTSVENVHDTGSDCLIYVLTRLLFDFEAYFQPWSL